MTAAGYGEDIRRSSVRSCGSEVEIAVDANQVFGVEDAVRFAKMAESYDLEWFEEVSTPMI